MPISLSLSLFAFFALLPAAFLPWASDYRRGAAYWTALALAVAGPLVLVSTEFREGWQTGLSAALWVSIAASLVIFAVLVGASREAWRLTPLLLPYLLVLAAIAVVWRDQPSRPMPDGVPPAWVLVHIALAVVTYGLLTLGAVAGLAVFLSERAVKRKSPTRITRRLPSVSDGEQLQIRLLTASAIVLGCGLLSGMATQFAETGQILVFAHKTAFSILTFAILVILVAVHHRTGLRGRRAARLLLIAYLFLTLAYPGVKFVTDVILAK